VRRFQPPAERTGAGTVEGLLLNVGEEVLRPVLNRLSMELVGRP